MSAKAPTCDRCGNDLAVYEVSYAHVSGRLPTLFGGVVCSKCHRVECMSCKNGPAERPCSWCGFPVVPADEDEIAGLGKRSAAGKRKGLSFFSLPGYWSKALPAAALLGALFMFLLPAIKLYAPMPGASSVPATAVTHEKSPEVKVPAPSAAKEVLRKLMGQMFGSSHDVVPDVVPLRKEPAKSQVKPSVATPAAAAKTVNVPAKGVEKGSTDVAIGDSLIGSRVRIVTRDGRSMEGFVTEDSGGIIALTRVYSKGTFNMSFHIDEIRTIIPVSPSPGG